MRDWLIARHGLKNLLLLVLILGSCAAPSDDSAGGGCGGSEASISCATVTSIAPSGVSGPTSDVDAQQNLCVDSQGVVVGVEPFAAHTAALTLRNQRFPTATATGRTFDIRVTGYSVAYRLNQCPGAARGCPPLSGFTIADSLFIPSGGNVTATIPFVPLATKNEYVRGGGELGIAAPSYSVIYTFTGQTVGLGDTFTFQGSAQFNITDYNNCP